MCELEDYSISSVSSVDGTLKIDAVFSKENEAVSQGENQILKIGGLFRGYFESLDKNRILPFSTQVAEECNETIEIINKNSSTIAVDIKSSDISNALLKTETEKSQSDSSVVITRNTAVYAVNLDAAAFRSIYSDVEHTNNIRHSMVIFK
ncbi:MAG: hypothetical protein GF350_00635 [Chitinivibrionales bacterium]|nr:hypothetical protein [Chitinivibrionales bacterium]